MVWVWRFIHRACRMDQSGGQELTAAELEGARRALFRVAQADGFPAELEALRLGKPVPVSSPLRRLSPFLTDCCASVAGSSSVSCRMKRSIHRSSRGVTWLT